MGVNERREIVALLQSDLYERVPDRDPERGMTWKSPLRWCVRITGSREEPVVQVWRPDGTNFWGPEPCTAVALDGILP